MILSDGAIHAALQAGAICVEPTIREDDIRGVGLRLYLSGDILVPLNSNREVDLSDIRDDQFEYHRIGPEGYLLESNRLILASTREKVWADRDLICRVDGRSSIARNGLSVHCSSSVIDNIHKEPRVIVLELYNCSHRALRLRSGLAIAMLTFERLEGRIVQDASPQYADQLGLLPPRHQSPPISRKD